MDPNFYTSQYDVLHRLGTAHAPLLIDVCVPQDVEADPFRLPGARRFSHADPTAIAAGLPTAAEVVVVCQKGLKLSLGVAAHLTARNVMARALEAGVMGWGAAGLPRMAEDAAATTYVMPAPYTAHAALSVWVIKRWIAPQADILWVPANTVAAVAERFDAVPADMPADLLTAAKLTWRPLHDFLAHAVAIPDGWPALLRAPMTLHQSPQEMINAALPVIDAAWTTLRKDMA